MQSMIRVHTFIKYGRIQLQEAEAALQEDKHDICFKKLADVGDSLAKTLAAALPTVKKDFLALEENALARYAEDLAPDPADAREAAALISEIRRLREEMPDLKDQDIRIKAENAYSTAGRAFKLIHDFFK